MAVKQKLLKITKADKTVHFAPITAKQRLTQQNTLKSDTGKMKIEEVEMTDEEISNHPPIDESFIHSEGNNSISVLKKLAASKEIENEELKTKIAELEANTGRAIVPPNVKAAELIVMIQNAESIKEVDELIGDDTRIAVSKAAQKRKDELNNL